jgi:hypothetical protein
LTGFDAAISASIVANEVHIIYVPTSSFSPVAVDLNAVRSIFFISFMYITHYSHQIRIKLFPPYQLENLFPGNRSATHTSKYP